MHVLHVLVYMHVCVCVCVGGGHVRGYLYKQEALQHQELISRPKLLLAYMYETIPGMGIAMGLHSSPQTTNMSLHSNYIRKYQTT